MVNINSIKKEITIYLLLGLTCALFLFGYLVINTYTQELSQFRNTLQKALTKKALIQRDLKVYKSNLQQLRAFSNNISNPRQAILKRIDSIKRLYPEAVIKPSRFTRNGNLVELRVSIILETDAYSKIVRFTDSLLKEKMPLFILNQLLIKPIFTKRSNPIVCNITGKFIAIEKND